MSPRALGTAGIVVVAALVAFALLRPTAQEGAIDEADPVATADQPAMKAADAFLDRYVDDDGRVVRRDQVGDTVSEGQAYGMLIAVAIDDRERFGRVWRWTQDNLQRSDGLLSFLWRDGAVADPQPASDADLDAARALVLAASRFDDKSYRKDALQLAEGIANFETAGSEGQRVLIAGPWAEYEDRLVVNPSYFAPRSYAILTRATRDDVWQELSASSRRLAAEVTADGTRLPPNWAVIRDTAINPSGPPGNDGEAPNYGFDAARLPLRYAESCDKRDRAIAAGVWQVLEPRGIDEL